MSDEIKNLLMQVENQIRRHNLDELPFGGSPYSLPVNPLPRIPSLPRLKFSTHDEGPKTKKRKIEEDKVSEQQKSLKIQKLQNAMRNAQRSVVNLERWGKETQVKFFCVVIYEA